MCLDHSQSCSSQDNDSSIKFSGLTRWLLAQPRRLLSLAPVGSSLSKGSAPLGLLTGRFCSLRPCPSALQNLATDFLQSGRAQLSALGCSSFPFLPNHCFRLYPHTLLYRADHTRRVDLFVLKFWDGSTVQNNLQLPICRFPTLLRLIFSQTSPASSTLGRRLTTASKPKLSAALSQSAPMLSSTRSRRAGRSSVDSEGWLGGSSVPASFLQQSSQQHGPL